MASILIVEDDHAVRRELAQVLLEEGYQVLTAGDGEQALLEMEDTIPDLILLDLILPGIDGLSLLEKIKKQYKQIIVIMVSGSSDLNLAVEAMKIGAFDFIKKPYNDQELLLVIRKALKINYDRRELENLKKRVYEHSDDEKVMGGSFLIQKVLKQVYLVGPTNMSVIIQGSSGTGKEVIANLIHTHSKRAQKPFVAVDCGAIPDTLVESELFGYEKGAFTGATSTKIGKFEAANGGTILLDEITNLPLESQAKLLRALEERMIQHVGGKSNIRVNVRVIATTNVNIFEETKKGNFRHDLFHRLNEFRVYLPDLKERKDDIPILANEFLQEANIDLNKAVGGISPDALNIMLNYHWPGNVREMKNIVKRAVLLCETELIEPRHLQLMIQIDPASYNIPDVIETGFSFEKVMNSVEKDLLLKALKQTKGNKSKAAALLGINRKALYRKLEKHELYSED
ncbi:sigma-54-dependent transcriptional regulator [Candidatus Cloacimonadota bacterium]